MAEKKAAKKAAKTAAQTAKPAGKRIARPAGKKAAKSAAERTAGPAAKKAADPAAKKAVRSAGKKIAKSAAKKAAGPAAKKAAKPAAKKTAKPAAKKAAKPAPKKAATKATTKAPTRAMKEAGKKPAPRPGPRVGKAGGQDVVSGTSAGQGSASALITARIRDLRDWRGEKLALVRRLIHEADPAIAEEWKWETPVWSRHGILCTGETYKQTVKLTFAKGAFLADPHRLFNAGLTGNVRRAIDLRAEDQVDAPAFRALIREAVAFNREHPPKSDRSRSGQRSTATVGKGTSAAGNRAAVARKGAGAAGDGATAARKGAATVGKGAAATGKGATATGKGATAAAKPDLLAGGNPQIAKADGDSPVRAYIAAMPGWKRDVGRRLDALIVRNVPNVEKAVKWNSPFYGLEGQGWFLSYHCFTKYVKVTFFRGTSLHPVPPGASKHDDVRYLDIREHDRLDEAQMAAWIRQAAALPGWVP